MRLQMASHLRTGMFAIAATAFVANMASAAPLTIKTYDLINGQSGFTTYRDDTYGGPGATGNPNVNGSSLAGGLGQLTDGVLGTNNIADNGYFDWIGWSTIQPTITFNFGALASIDRISFRTANNSPSFSDVAVFGSASRSYSIDGVTFFSLANYLTTATDRTGDASRWVDIPFAVNAQYVRVQLFDGTKIGGTNPGAKPWIFVSEATGDGIYLPEPGAIALLGFGLMGLALRRRKAAAV